jgi:predicted GIY-YIG superfamily endonuclease
MGKHRAPDITTAGGARTEYLIHFDTPYKHAKHYTGSTTDLARRVAEHRAGRGARLMEVITDAGIDWDVVRTWEGTRTLERAIKDLHAAPRLCPECSPHPLPLDTERLMARHAQARPSELESQLARELESQLARELQPSPVLVPEPGASLSSVWPGQAASPELYQELDEPTARLVDGWRAALPAPEADPPGATAVPAEAEARAAPAEPEAELELC